MSTSPLEALINLEVLKAVKSVAPVAETLPDISRTNTENDERAKHVDDSLKCGQKTWILT